VEKIASFKDIIAWKKAHEYALFVYKLTTNDAFCKDYALKDQIRRAAISVSSNIVEGYERKSTKEFIRFLRIAQSSCSESYAQLILAKDLGYISDTDFLSGEKLWLDVSNLIGGFLKYLNNLNNKNSAE